MGPHCSKSDVTFSLINFKRPENRSSLGQNFWQSHFFSSKLPSWLNNVTKPHQGSNRHYIAFPPKFPFLFNKVSFHIRMIFPKKLWDWETLLWGCEKSSKIVWLTAESWDREFAGLYVPTKKQLACLPSRPGKNTPKC